MEKNTKVIIGVAFFLIIILLFFIFFSTFNPGNENEIVNVNTGLIEARGNGTIEIIEFSDFQCPICGEQEPILKQVLDNFGDKIRLYYRQFPLSIHKNSFEAALASMCAEEQGKFWEYHDLLFENQIALDKTSLKNYAEQLDLNLEQFDSCFDKEKYKKEIKNDIKEGKQAGVKGTPTFFINGKRIEGFRDFEFFKELIIKS